MKYSDIPQQFALPFGGKADSTTITTIPHDKPAIGRASMSLGFSKDNGTPLAAGGVPPYLEDMNGILNMLSVTARASEISLLRSFSQEYATAIGGYPKGTLIAHPTDNGKFLISTEDNNLNNPAQSLTGWSDHIATKTDVQTETTRAQTAESKLLPISGGTATGGIYVDGNFTDANGQILSQPNGNAIGGNQFYTQLAQDPSGNLFGRLIMKNNGKWTHVLECTPDGRLSNINGKSLAIIDDVNTETQRAKQAEAQLLP